MASKKTDKTKIKSKNPGTTPKRLSFFARLKQMDNTELNELLKRESIRFLAGFCGMVCSLFILVSIISNFFTGKDDWSGVQAHNLEHANNYCGKLGAYVSYFFMDHCFGVFSFLIPLFLLVASMKLMNAYKVRLWKWFINCSILMIWGSVMLSLTSEILPQSVVGDMSFRLGGGHGDFIRLWLTDNIGTLGAWIVVITAAVFYLTYLTGETMRFIRKLLHPQDYLQKMKAKGEATKDEGENDSSSETANLLEDNTEEEDLYSNNGADAASDDADNTPSEQVTLDLDNIPSSTSVEDTIEEDTNDDYSKPTPATASDTELTIEKTEKDDEADGKTVEEQTEDNEPYDPRKDLEYYKFPTIPLLKHYTDNGPEIDMAEQTSNKDRIITVLRSFGVEISSIKATIGPTITLYEVTPAAGVRINKIRNLEDDIALSLSALGIRIIAPIPGKGTIGIEVPNKNPRIVSMESIINTRKFQESTFELPIALGKTITNEVFMVDLAKMPHLLVAGATGQGKSVGLNAIITSLLYKKHPAELKFVMVDPKKVEFSIYAPIERHFLAKIPDENEDPIITDVTKVVQTLKSLCQLMDHRYDLLKKAKVRNIKEYNAKFKARQLNPENGHEFMPYIVVIIDEFGDLIMTAGKEVELPIARIAQLARAVGMHMVIATQRPTTNIITGTIKANFPARMAFKVMSQIDSRTILDQGGANQLIGKGDMLFLAGNMPVRVQCAFVDTPEVEKINEFISEQQGYISAFELPEPEMDGEEGGKSNDLDTSNLDPIFEEAARLIVVHQSGSTSLIQRKFSIGYNRAGRLMDQLERAGIVGPTKGSKPREVLVPDEITLDSLIANLHAGLTPN